MLTPGIKKWSFLISLIYMCLSIGSITTSSLAIAELRVSNTTYSQGVLHGTPQGIRSDEYLRTTPWKIGLLRTGNTNFTSPLSSKDSSLAFPDLDSFTGKLLGLETFVIKAIPVLTLSQKFALNWWYPVLLTLLFVPIFLKLIGVRENIGFLAACLIVLTPVASWWSYLPLYSVGYCAFLGALVIASTRQPRIILNILLSSFAAVVAFRLIATYQPWTIVFASLFGVLTVCYIYSNWSLPSTRLSVLTLIVVLGTLGTLFYYKSHSAIAVLANTSYPGDRRARPLLGVPIQFWTSQFELVVHSARKLRILNFSELSSSSILFAFAAGGQLAISKIIPRLKIYLIASFCSICFWILWGFGMFGNLAKRMALINLVEPSRGIAVLGMLTIIFFAISSENFLSSFEIQNSKAVITVTVMIAGSFLLISAFQVSSIVSPFRLKTSLMMSLLSLFGIFAFLHKKLFLVGAFTLLGLSFISIVNINPIQVGLGSFNRIEIRSAFEANSGEQTNLWANDNSVIDATLMANGVRTLSGQQTIGPDSAAWLSLDPTKENLSTWNRGASYIIFDWNNSDSPKISNPSPDVILISISPCSSKLAKFGLDRVSSEFRLQEGCLTEIATIMWRKKVFYVYAIHN